MVPVLPPEVLLSLLWASQVPVPSAGPLSGFNLRIESPFVGAVSPVILPSLLGCLAHRVWATTSVLLRGLKAASPSWLAIYGSPIYGAFAVAFHRVVSILALLFPRPLQSGLVIILPVLVSKWPSLMVVLRRRFPTISAPHEVLLASLPAHRAVRVAQAHYQQISFAAQLAVAASA